jgi:hypothetical protein
MIHTTIGLYANGDYKINGVHEDHLEGHITYNKLMRPGRALFVDGKCVFGGYLSEETCNGFEQTIEEEGFKMNKDTMPYE